MLNKHVQIKNNSHPVSHFSLNTCSVLNRDYLAGRSWLSSLFLRSQVAERGPHVCTGTAAVPQGRCYLQLNPLMLLITHHTVCLCVCVYLSMHTTREHIGTLRRCSWCTISHAIMAPKKKKKKQIEIAAGLRDANLLRGNVVLWETREIIKHETS